MKNMLFKLIVLFLSTNAFVSFASAEISTENLPKVRMVYIVPIDKVYNSKYEQRMKKAIMHLQDFYLKEMDYEKTFFVNNSIIEVIKSRYSSSIFSQTMWSTAIDEAIDHLGATWNDPNNRWLLFVDADVACDGQGIGGNSGFAVMSANDLRGLSGERQIYDCKKDSTVPQYNTPARWVGGLGHELAHSWLVPHPPECDPERTSACPIKALMDLGYRNYPNTFLLETDKNILNFNDFITNKPVADSVFNFFEKRLPNFFPNHVVSRNTAGGRYSRKYANGAVLAEDNGILLYKLSNSDSLRSLSTPIKDIFTKQIKSLNNIANDFLSEEGKSTPSISINSYGFKNKWLESNLNFNGIERWELIQKSNGYVNICERGNKNKCLHNEYGTLQLSSIQSGWLSAQWILENSSTGFVKIRNRWKASEYIHTESGTPAIGRIQPYWWSAQWSKFIY